MGYFFYKTKFEIIYFEIFLLSHNEAKFISQSQKL